MAIFSDSFQRRAHFCRAMFYMLAKRNFKQTCIGLWNAFSNLIHEEPDLPAETFFDATFSRKGKILSFTYHGHKWSELVADAVETGPPQHLKKYGSLAWLIAAYVSIVPYRASTNVLMWLDTQLDVTWFSEAHKP